jgi:hypothetical protein
MSREQALCQKCSEITLALPVSKTLLREYPDTPSLHATADEGCAFCILIHASHQTYHDAMSKQRIRPWIENEFRHSKISVYHWIYDSIDLESNIRWECSHGDSIQSHSNASNLGGFFAFL